MVGSELLEKWRGFNMDFCRDVREVGCRESSNESRWTLDSRNPPIVRRQDSRTDKSYRFSSWETLRIEYAQPFQRRWGLNRAQGILKSGVQCAPNCHDAGQRLCKIKCNRGGPACITGFQIPRLMDTRRRDEMVPAVDGYLFGITGNFKGAASSPDN